MPYDATTKAIKHEMTWRKKRLYAITDPLWKAIAQGNQLETDRLMRQLKMLLIEYPYSEVEERFEMV